MIKYGIDADASGNAVCGFHRLPDKNAIAGYQLFVFGSEPPEHSVCPDSHRRSLETVQALLEQGLDELAINDGRTDIQFVAARVSDILQQCNRRIYELATFLGQSIAIGGAVLFLSDHTCFSIAFGGARMYFWNSKTLYPQGEIPSADGLIKDALGTRPVWNGNYWYGNLMTGQRVICASAVFQDLEKISRIIATNASPYSHENTVVMHLRKELEIHNILPTTIIEISIWDKEDK